jgi:hypothetical protein
VIIASPQRLNRVIASEAKQSSLSLRRAMDCFGRFAHRNDGSVGWAEGSDPHRFTGTLDGIASLHPSCLVISPHDAPTRDPRSSNAPRALPFMHEPAAMSEIIGHQKIARHGGARQ